MDFKNNNLGKRRGRFDDLDSNNWLEDREWDKLNQKAKSSISSSAFDKPRNDSPREKVDLNIRLTVPKPKTLTRFKNITSLDLLKNRKLTYFSATFLVVAIAGASFYSFKGNNSSKVAGVSEASNVASGPTNEPLFEIVKPEGREITKESIVFDPERLFAKYDDEINGIPITVSQQPFPDIYRSDVEGGVSKIAKDFGAKETLTYEGQTMYYGQDFEGPQTVVLSKNDLLVFILTTKAVDKLALQVYAGNLN